MSRARRCFVHVGCPKTGTSYLQSVLWASRPALLEQGIRIPLRRSRDHFYLTLLLRERAIPEVDGRAVFNVMERLAADLAKTPSRDVLITHELLAPVSQEQAVRFKRLLQPSEIHIIITARDLARQLPAEWQQQIKTRDVISYEKFLSAVTEHHAKRFWSAQDVVDIAERWGSDLPAERVHIVTTPPSGAPAHLLLERYCEVLGIDPRRLTTERARRNPSLGVAQTELLRMVNIALGDRLPHPRTGYARIGRNYFANRVLAPQPGDPIGLPPDVRQWCRESGEATALKIEERGYSVHGDLADLVPAATVPDSGRTDVAEAQVLEAAAAALATLLAQRAEDLKTIRLLRQKSRDPRHPVHPGGRGPSAAALIGGKGRAAVKKLTDRTRRPLGQREGRG